MTGPSTTTSDGILLHGMQKVRVVARRAYTATVAAGSRLREPFSDAPQTSRDIPSGVLHDRAGP